MKTYTCPRQSAFAAPAVDDRLYDDSKDPILGNKFQELGDIAEYVDEVLPQDDLQNLAYNKDKPVMVKELCNHPEMMTQGYLYEKDLHGKYGYTGTYGYCGTHVPAYLTLDLGRNEDIGLIMFLLWDDRVDFNQGDQERRYYYRLLAAEDREEHDRDEIEWKVLYDSEKSGYRNWQIFRIANPEGIRARYIRIHGVYNSKNDGFHVVRIRVYKPVVAGHLNVDKLEKALHNQRQYTREPNRSRRAAGGGRSKKERRTIDRCGLAQIKTIDVGPDTPTEIGDGTPLSKRISDIASVMQRTDTSWFNSFDVKKRELDGINDMVRNSLESGKGKYIIRTNNDVERIIRSIADDIGIIEKNSDGIERIIVNPVNVNLKSSIFQNAAINFITLLATLYSVLTSEDATFELVGCLIIGILALELVILLCGFFRVSRSLHRTDDERTDEKNPNIALGRPVLEAACPHSDKKADINKRAGICTENGCAACLHPVQLTDGNAGGYDGNPTKGYSEFSGFCGVIYPGYVTVDLGAETEVSTVQFLLWDNRGNDKKESPKTRYSYRLLYAEDSGVTNDGEPAVWHVAYDMIRGIEPGWQVFHFVRPVRMRYIRIHAISSTSSGWHVFRIVQIEAYRHLLERYDYNYIPSFVWKIISDPPRTDASQRNSGRIDRYYKLTGFFDIIIRKISERAEALVDDYLGRTKLRILQNDMELVQQELRQHEACINEQIGRLLYGTNAYFKYSTTITLISMFLLVISIIMLVIQH